MIVENEKMENLLNLALDATPEEREKSLELSVGYDRTERTWEVIVKTGADEETLRAAIEQLSPGAGSRIRIVNLSNEYMILELPEGLAGPVASLPQVEYMEKPKRLFFAVNNGKRASCVTALQSGGAGVGRVMTGASDLTGDGVIIAVIDSGIDYSHPDFRNPDGTTRILSLWDQTVPAESVRPVSAPGEQTPAPPEGFFLGTEFSREVINRALEEPTEQQRYAVCPSRDSSGHGTHVAGIAAENGRASEGRYRGVAYNSSLIIVKLGLQKEGAFPRTTELMQAVDYCHKKAEEYGMPLVINLSFGNNYGSHSGTSLIETYLDDMANYGRVSIIIGSGNEGASAVHTSGRVAGGQTKVVEFAVSEYESAINLQIWKSYVDDMAISVTHPGGVTVGPVRKLQGTQRFQIQNTEILLYYGEPGPYSRFQEIFFDFLPVRDYIDAGVWEIRLVPQRIVQGNFDMWLPSGGVLNTGTGFLFPTEETTLTIPSTAGKAVTVGAYDAWYDRAASFSGRGYTRETNQVKPDLAAPGVEITSCAPGGGYTVRSGTSMATPFVSGGAALLMQWGIVNGNDRYLYGEKMKAYLIRGARQIPALKEWPNPQMGYGALCVRDSLPG